MPSAGSPSLARLAVLVGVLAGGWPASPAAAQLISPGRLASVHADLEGVRNCTQCHRLRERGIAADLCLSCHTPLRTRIEEDRGYHATVAGQDCADCHKEHFGVDFALVRLDTVAFAHDTVGYRLEERHAELDCRDCHRAELVVAADARDAKGAHGALDRTYLGLGTTCTDCHANDDPHEGQFRDRECTDCHTQRRWDGAERFAHSRTSYPLTGRHRTLECTECHTPVPGDTTVRWAALPFARCTDCHRDPHETRMGTDCTRCHVTDGWHRLPGAAFEEDFDHESVGYPLRGAHAPLACAACHTADAAGAEGIRLLFEPGSTNLRYPPPASEDCSSCHLDYHDGAFTQTPGGSECRSCHGEEAWIPTSYGIARHNDGSTYELTGAHLATPCVTCHRDPAGDSDAMRFRIPHETCVACHSETEQHGTQFAGRACSDCHSTHTFRITVFDHSHTRYPLDGRHRDVACDACHSMETDASGRTVRRYRPVETRCEACHGGGG